MNVIQFMDKIADVVFDAAQRSCPECGKPVAISLTRYIDPTGELPSMVHIHTICTWCEWYNDQSLTDKLDLDGLIDNS